MRNYSRLQPLISSDKSLFDTTNYDSSCIQLNLIERLILVCTFDIWRSNYSCHGCIKLNHNWNYLSSTQAPQTGVRVAMWAIYTLVWESKYYKMKVKSFRVRLRLSLPVLSFWLINLLTRPLSALWLKVRKRLLSIYFHRGWYSKPANCK